MQSTNRNIYIENLIDELTSGANIRQDTIDDIKRYLSHGQTFHRSGNFVLAIDNYNRALDIAKETQIEFLQGVICGYIADIYYGLRDFALAKKWYMNALTFFSSKKLGNGILAKIYMSLLANMGYCLVKTDKLSSAEKYYDFLSDMENGPYYESFPRINIYTFFAVYQIALADIDEADYFAGQAKEALLETEDLYHDLDIVWNLLDILIEIEEYDEMLSALAFVMDYSKAKGNLDILIQAVDYQLRYCSKYMSDDEYLDMSRYYFSLKQENIDNDNTAIKHMIEMQGQIADIEKNRKKLADQNMILSYQAEHDGLTGLYNRGAFDSKSPLLCSSAAENKTSFAVLFIDIDYFKQMNDIYGHLQGDNCIRTIATCIKDATPENCSYRYGGDEFVAILTGPSKLEVLSIGEKIVRSVLDMNIEHKGNKDRGILSVTVGGSFGYPTKVNNLGTFLEKADEAVYIQKEQKKGGFNLITIEE